MRPGAARGRFAAPDEGESCPFCEGEEPTTPPETFVVGRDGGPADGRGWTVRVVPNLYPALERQEVVVHTPRHVASMAELEPDELGAVAEAWRARANAARAEGFPYVHALVNEGRDAGASRFHSHSQLVWLRCPPPAVAAEEPALADDCTVCAFLADEVRDGTRVVAVDSNLALLASYAGRLPYELLLAPLAHPAGSAFDSDLLAGALGLLAGGIRRLHALEGRVPLNAWLHDGAHWHIEIVPRLTVLAGLELGAGIYVNSLLPEDAARALAAARV